MHTFLRPLLPLLFLLLTAPLQAQRDRVSDWTVSISPIQLVIPIVSLSSERSVAQDVGFGGRISAGSVNNSTAFGGGIFANYYAIGDFDHGMMIGGSLNYAHAEGSDQEITATANGVGLGPHIGYKVNFGFGLTTSLQLGGAYIIATGSGTDGTSSASVSANGFAATGDLKVGWSF